MLLKFQQLANQYNTKGPSHYFFLNTPLEIRVFSARSESCSSGGYLNLDEFNIEAGYVKR